MMNSSCNHLSSLLLVCYRIQLTNSTTFNKHLDVITHSNPEKSISNLFQCSSNTAMHMSLVIVLDQLFPISSSNDKSKYRLTFSYPKYTMIEHLIYQYIIEQYRILIMSSYSINNLVDIWISLLSFEYQLILFISR